MLGLKSFQTAEVVIGGIELAEKIKKDNSRWASWVGAGRRCLRSGEPLWRRDRYRNQSYNDSGRICRNSQFAPEPLARRAKLPRARPELRHSREMTHLCSRKVTQITARYQYQGLGDCERAGNEQGAQTLDTRVGLAPRMLL